ncbi:MAG: hypothetical protein ACFB9M_04360 [Myxococcota bacterium]
MQTTILAPLALLGLVPLCIFLFNTQSESKAVAHTTLAAQFFLPVVLSFDLPLLPPLDKHTIPVFCCTAALLLKKDFRKILFSRYAIFLIIISTISSLGTWRTNRDVLVYPGFTQVVLPGLVAKDAVSIEVATLAAYFLPFVIGAYVFRTTTARTTLLKLICFYLIIYIPLILFEIRFSPQLHYWLYGFYPQSFGQTLRFGGYRPVVFMNHGLVLGLMLLIGATSLAVLKPRKRLQIAFGLNAGLWLIPFCILLVLAKSFGAILIGLIAIPVMLRLPRRGPQILGLVFSLLFVTYPLLKLGQLVPEEEILAYFNSVSPDRAQSLEYRLYNENLLLDKARERFMFGWAGYSRSFVYSPWGKPNTVDGFWIVEMGTGGVAKFMFVVCVLVVPVVWSVRKLRKLPRSFDRRVITGLILLVGIWSFDLIPNGFPRNVLFMMAGSLYAFARERLPKKQAYRGPSSVYPGASYPPQPQYGPGT